MRTHTHAHTCRNLGASLPALQTLLITGSADVVKETIFYLVTLKQVRFKCATTSSIV